MRTFVDLCSVVLRAVYFWALGIMMSSSMFSDRAPLFPARGSNSEHDLPILDEGDSIFSLSKWEGQRLDRAKELQSRCAMDGSRMREVRLTLLECRLCCDVKDGMDRWPRDKFTQGRDDVGM